MSRTEADFRSDPIALMAALPDEGELLLTQLPLRRIISGGGHQIYGGNFAGREVLLAFSGLGKINAAATAATILANFSVSRIWMWGSAGAYPLPDIEINDLALASVEILGDEGVATVSSWRSLEAIGIPLAASNEGPIYNRIPVDQRELERAHHLLQKWRHTSLPPQTHVGPFITVSAVSGSLARARQLADRFGALCENMEGGAVAQVCFQYQVPFLEIRGISNWAGDRNRRRWQLTTALENCQEAMLHLLENWDKV